MVVTRSRASGDGLRDEDRARKKFKQSDDPRDKESTPTAFQKEINADKPGDVPLLPRNADRRCEPKGKSAEGAAAELQGRAANPAAAAAVAAELHVPASGNKTVECNSTVVERPRTTAVPLPKQSTKSTAAAAALDEYDALFDDFDADDIATGRVSRTLLTLSTPCPAESKRACTQLHYQTRPHRHAHRCGQKQLANLIYARADSLKLRSTRTVCLCNEM